MEELKKKVEKKRQELDDLMLEMVVKAKEFDHYHSYHIKEQLEKAAIWVQQANGKLFYALTALGN